MRFLNSLSSTEQGGVKILDKDFIICKTRTELCEFIQPMTEQLDRHRKKFLRQVIGAMFAMGFLTWVLLKSRLLTGKLLSLTSRFRKQVPFIYYRLLDGLQEFGRLRYPSRDKLLPQPLENG
jgi:hypothetical protein